MKSETSIEVFIHNHQDQVRVVEAEPVETIGGVLNRAGLKPGPDMHVFVGESTIALTDDSESDDAADVHELAHADESLATLTHGRFVHVHCHRCRHITIAVHYQGRTARRRFSPSATVATVLAWARRRFRLSDPANSNLLLQLCGTRKRPRPELHVGEIVAHGACELCFDLVPDERVEG